VFSFRATAPQIRQNRGGKWNVARGRAAEVAVFVFGLLTDADVEWMARTGEQRRIKDGEVLIREGEPLTSIILLLQGECAVSDRGAGEIARLGVGEILGEMSFLDSAPPSATVTAVGDGLALFLDKKTLAHRLESDIAFASRFYRALAVFLADRLRTTVRRLGRASTADPASGRDDFDSRKSGSGRRRLDRLRETLTGRR
jgi:CRP/FNR family cyclic AMP-dependent transcriptional regulator